MDAALIGVTILASEAEEGGSNFLIPNGTFFFVLAIFLVVFGVIAKFVVQPVQKVLEERDRIVAQTAVDNRQAAEQDAAADRDYRQELASARSEAGGIRDQVRLEGRQVVEEQRTKANEEVAGSLREAGATLNAEVGALAPSLNASVEDLSTSLAKRILGADGSSSSGSSGR